MQVAECDKRLAKIQVPHDFNRSVKGLNNVKHWKASEYRSWGSCSILFQFWKVFFLNRITPTIAYSWHQCISFRTIWFPQTTLPQLKTFFSSSTKNALTSMVWRLDLYFKCTFQLYRLLSHSHRSPSMHHECSSSSPSSWLCRKLGTPLGLFMLSFWKYEWAYKITLPWYSLYEFSGTVFAHTTITLIVYIMFI